MLLHGLSYMHTADSVAAPVVTGANTEKAETLTEKSKKTAAEAKKTATETTESSRKEKTYVA